MNFDQWWKDSSLSKNFPSDCWLAREAWNAAIANVKTLPHRAMFDEGLAIGQAAAAEECIALILGWEGAWSVLDFKDAIKEKFGLAA